MRLSRSKPQWECDYLVYGILDLLDDMRGHWLGEVHRTHLGAEGIVERSDLDLINDGRHFLCTLFGEGLGEINSINSQSMILNGSPEP